MTGRGRAREAAGPIKLVVVGMAKRGMKERSEDVVAGQEIREATTGRVVAVLPRVWATAQGAMEAPRARENGSEGGRRKRVRPELAFYRKYTEGMLRRYVQMCMESGRVPSMMGREMFRGKVTSYRIRTFEDVVIFRLDVERCLAKLAWDELQLVKRIALQEYTRGEAAAMLGMSLRGCAQRYGEAVDRVTEMFLQRRMLEPLAGLSSGEDVEV